MDNVLTFPEILSELGKERAEIATWTIFSNIRQYCTILHNIGQYFAKSENIYQYLAKL